MENKKMTLQDILQSQEKELQLVEKQKEAEVQSEILKINKEIRELLQKILDKPDPIFPEQKEIKFPEVQEVSMKKPDWFKPKETESIKPLFDRLEKTILAEGMKMREVLNGLAEKETEKVELEAKTVNTGSVRSRRTTQWKIATFPQVAGTLGLVSAGDGFTYYLPSACIPNSETIRLNQGLPLSQGIDYTLTGNKILYVQNQTNSQQEVRYQVK